MPDESPSSQSKSSSPAGPGAAPGPVEVLVSAPAWEAEGLAETVRRAAEAALSATGWTAAGLDSGRSELSIELADDARVARLNEEFRDKPGPTNVLSFPGLSPAELTAAKHASTDEPPLLLGDVMLAYETAAREAREQGKPLTHHVAHLTVHGTLHCLGHDHLVEEEAEEMEAEERRILAGLGVPDPYSLGETAPEAQR